MQTIDLSTLVANLSSPKYDPAFPLGNRPVSSWQLAAGHFQGYIAPLITYPRPDNETSAYARHRGNYPGQTYRVPILVHGGAYPFKYEFISAVPSGMTVGSTLSIVNGKQVAGPDYGIINWPNSAAGTYTITVRVTDQSDLTRDITWQLVVSTTNWIFLDPAAVTDGNGTLGSPYNTLASIANQNTKRLLVKTGVVDLEQKTVGLQDMPRTWLPYNNGAVTLNQAMSSFYGNTANDLWFSGFTWNIPSNRTDVNQYLAFDESSRIILFENIIDLGKYNNTTGQVGGTNSSFIMWTGGNPTNAQYSGIKNNIFRNIADRDLVLVYENHYMVIEGNGIENYGSGAHGWDNGFYLKMSIDNSTIRGNYSIGNLNTASLLRIDAYEGEFPMDYFDISYNSYRYSGNEEGAINFCHEFINFGSHRYIYRNTFVAIDSGASAVYLRGMGVGDIVTLSNNVLVSAGTVINGVTYDQFQGTASNTGYVAGNLAAGIVDANNFLANSYVSNLGTKGAEII